MKNFLKGVYENDLYPPMAEYFTKHGYSIELEIPIHRNRIDMIAYDQERLIAVELKLKDWRRALRQAAYYQFGSDLSYIAMPFYQAIEAHKRRYQLDKEGIGLFAVILGTGEIRELIKAQQSEKKIEFMVRGIYSTIRKRW
jgi:hypothetical protein